MPLNTFSLGPRPVGLPEFCGPDDLSEVIISYREHDQRSEWFAPISNDGIRQLINLAYYTSLVTEEGRYPRFRLMSVDYTTADIWYAAEFDTVIDDVESLRRLAPAVSDTDAALLITEHDNVLHCIGSIIVSDMGFGTQIGRPETGFVGRSPSLIVRVDGPGRLRATEMISTFVLDRGRIQQVVDYRSVPQIQELWENLAFRMLDSIASTLGEESQKYFGGSFGFTETIHRVWSKVLATAIDKQHGGAFVVLPVEKNTEDVDIYCKYPTQMQFGEDIRQFLQSCINYAVAKDDREREKAAHRWNWRRAAMFTKAEILAGLSSVDGCVALDQNLKVLGFGGEIRVNEKKVQTAPRSLKNIKTGQPMEDELKQMGTRHRSAYRLAKVYPGIIVFVISQDGDLRIFCSDENDVFGFDRLYAWVYQYESM